jgi:hypothetical protein
MKKGHNPMGQNKFLVPILAWPKSRMWWTVVVVQAAEHLQGTLNVDLHHAGWRDAGQLVENLSTTQRYIFYSMITSTL